MLFRSQKRVEKPKPVQAKTEPALRPVVAPIAALSPPPKEEKLPMAIQKGPVVTQDPIPDTSLPPAAPMKPQAEVPKVESPSPKLEPLAQKVEPPPAALVPPVAAEKIAPKRAPPAEASASSIEGSSSNNSKFRRMLYVVLILAIGGAAFYFTRTPKRPRGDLLDIGAEASPRPKLPTKDSQKSNIG